MYIYIIFYFIKLFTNKFTRVEKYVKILPRSHGTPQSIATQRLQAWEGCSHGLPQVPQ